MERIKNGDNAAFATLMRRHARKVLAVGRRVLRDQCAAEELVQDVFLLVHRRSHSFDAARGEFRPWLNRIAYNQAFRSLERVRLRHTYEDQGIESYLEELVAPDTPEFQALIEQSASNLRRTLKQLSAKQEETLSLFFFEGYTLREISERTGDSLSNIRHYYYRALKALKDTIKSPGTKES